MVSSKGGYKESKIPKRNVNKVSRVTTKKEIVGIGLKIEWKNRSRDKRNLNKPACDRRVYLEGWEG